MPKITIVSKVSSIYDEKAPTYEKRDNLATEVRIKWSSLKRDFLSSKFLTRPMPDGLEGPEIAAPGKLKRDHSDVDETAPKSNSSAHYEQGDQALREGTRQASSRTEEGDEGVDRGWRHQIRRNNRQSSYEEVGDRDEEAQEAAQFSGEAIRVYLNPPQEGCSVCSPYRSTGMVSHGGSLDPP